MSKKVTDLLVWVLLGVICLIVVWQALDYFHFRHAGPRFTANNGQDVCRSVQDLQRHAGLPVRECKFGE